MAFENVGLPNPKKPEHWDEHCVGYDRDGHLVVAGRTGWREPKCCKCGDAIPWVLDMMSFVAIRDGAFFAAAHAACAWKPEAFDDQRRRSKQIAPTS